MVLHLESITTGGVKPSRDDGQITIHLEVFFAETFLVCD